MDRRMPDFPVHHQHLELAQTHVNWVSDAIELSSSVVPFSYYFQSFPESGSFSMSQFFASGSQSVGASSSSSALPMNIQDQFLLGLSGLISLQSKGLARVFSNTTIQKHQFFSPQPSLWSNSMVQLYGPTLWSTLWSNTSIHDYWINHSIDYMELVGKVTVPLFNMLSRFLIPFLPRSKHLLISCLQSPPTVILEPKK